MKNKAGYTILEKSCSPYLEKDKVMKSIKKIGVSLLVAVAVIMMAVPAALSLDLKDDIARAPVAVPSSSASIRVLSEQESRSLNVLKAPTVNADAGFSTGVYWRCTGDDEVSTICRIAIVFCNDDQTNCVETT